MKRKSRLLPPTYFYSILIIAIISHFLYPITMLIKQPYSFIGIIIVVIGILLNIWTDVIFKKRNTTVKPYEAPSHLIVEGPFKISRHPMYLGMLVILFGFSIFLGSIVSFIFPLIYFLIIEYYFIPFEEQKLEEVFEKDFINYKKRVRRWI